MNADVEVALQEFEDQLAIVREAHARTLQALDEATASLGYVREALEAEPTNEVKP